MSYSSIVAIVTPTPAVQVCLYVTHPPAVVAGATSVDEEAVLFMTTPFIFNCIFAGSVGEVEVIVLKK
ncbi:hypothetical protein D3C72_2336040 [compost metagenome]